MTGEHQTIPVRIYDREKHIVLAAPLPGLEAENISVVVGGRRVVITGRRTRPAAARTRCARLRVDYWTVL